MHKFFAIVVLRKVDNQRGVFDMRFIAMIFR